METRKGILNLFLFLSILCFGVLNVEAESIDVSRASSLTLTYQYENEKFSNVDVSLYHLATFDVSGQYQFTDSYVDVAFDPNGMSVSDLNLKGEEIETFITDNNLQPSSLQKTDQNGVTNFSNLVPGMYLVLVDSTEVGNYRYSASPMLVSIPILEDGTYQYDVQMNVKTEREELGQEVTPPSDDGEIDSVPNTIDNIMLYVGLLVVSILVIFGVMIYIFRKKKGDKNEEKK